MSAINGDKSRFHRQRKQKIARRLRNQALFMSQAKSGPAAPEAGTKRRKATS